MRSLRGPRSRASFLARDFASYLVVSAGALGVDLAVFAWAVGHGVLAGLASATGYVAGLGMHYLLSSRFAYRGRMAQGSLRAEAPALAIFLLTGLAGLAVTFATVSLLNGVFGLGPMPAKSAAVALSFLAVFAARRLLLFRPTAASAPF